MTTQVEVGYWCVGCQTFEVDENPQTKGRCLACGCPTENHRPAKVVLSNVKE